jgi:hypothetical protein
VNGLTGYRHPDYAAALAEFGRPRLLPKSGGWVLERPIDGLPFRDGMGCYPIFTCGDWSALEADLDELAGSLVSLSLVTDPFGDCDAPSLRRAFPDRLLPFKEHFVADLVHGAQASVRPHHRYYALRALKEVEVERCDEPVRFLDEWVGLYDTLVARHQLRGLQAFSRASFARQLAVPGIAMLRAVHDGQTVAAHLWYRQGEVAHSHLAASSPRGYALMASYALCWIALSTFADEVRWLNFGAGAGLVGGGPDGLTRFKQGWTTGTRTAFFCGRIFDRRNYGVAVAARASADSDYFPAYRRGEFA